MRRITVAAAAIAVCVLGACKKTGEGEYEVQKPVVGTVAETVKTPTVSVGVDSTKIVTPRVEVKKDTTTVKVPKVKVKVP